MWTARHRASTSMSVAVASTRLHRATRLHSCINLCRASRWRQCGCTRSHLRRSRADTIPGVGCGFCSCGASVRRWWRRWHMPGCWRRHRHRSSGSGKPRQRLKKLSASDDPSPQHVLELDGCVGFARGLRVGRRWWDRSARRRRRGSAVARGSGSPCRATHGGGGVAIGCAQPARRRGLVGRARHDDCSHTHTAARGWRQDGAASKSGPWCSEGAAVAGAALATVARGSAAAAQQGASPIRFAGARQWPLAQHRHLITCGKGHHCVPGSARTLESDVNLRQWRGVCCERHRVLR